VIHPRYYDWWQAFRRASNENEILTSWVPECVNKILQKEHPSQPWALVDIGAFEGKQALNISQHVDPKPGQVFLIEPSKSIQEAPTLFQQSGIDMIPQIFQTSAEEGVEKLPMGQQLSTLVHSAYYIPGSTLDRIREISSLGMLVFVDTMFSVFARAGKALNLELWERLHRANIWLTENGTCLSRRTINVFCGDHTLLEGIYSFIAMNEFRALPINQQHMLEEICSADMDEHKNLQVEVECWYCRP